MTQALHIPADPNQPLSVVDTSLVTLQSLVGGWIEAVPTNGRDHEISLYCNEEGKLQNLPLNSRATLLWAMLYGEPLDDVLAGDVVVTGGVDRNGDDKSVSDQIINLIPQVTS